MANIAINTANVVTHYSAKVIAQVETFEVFRPLLGETGDKSSFIYQAPERYRNGKTCRIPLRKAITDSAIEDGATYEGNEKVTLFSETDITANERGLPFGGISTFEELQTVVALRDEHADEAAQWFAQDFDSTAISALALATTSLPAEGDFSSSQYNVYYCGDADSWDNIQAGHKLTPDDISKARVWFEQRGMRPGTMGGWTGYMMMMPSEALLDMQYNSTYYSALKDALPRDLDHVFFKGHGLKPWGYWDDVLIVREIRPVYGGTDYTFLTTDRTTLAEQKALKFEAIFMGAQGVAFHEWRPITWFERIYEYGRKFGIAVYSTYGFAKTVIDLNATLEGGTDRDYGIGYLCGAANILY